MSKKPHTEILGTHPIGALLARIAIPSSIALFVTSTYSMADAVFVGRGVGAVAIGALTVVMPFQMLVMATGSLIGIGASSIVSRAFGAGESHRANHAAGTAITVAIIGGIVAVVLGEIWIDSILRVLGASGELLIVARRYLSVVLLTEPIIMFNLATNALMRAEGQAKYAMVTMMSGMFLNIALDPLFIFGFGFGVRGAAWATLIGRSLTTVLVLLYLLRGKSSIRITLSDLVPRFATVREISMIGISSFVRQAGSSIAAMIRNNLLVAYGGAMFVSSFGAVFRTIVFLGMPGMGIAQAVQPIAGFNYGAKRFDRVRRSVWVSIAVCTAFMTIGFLVTELFPGMFLRLFSSDASLVGEGVSIMRISAFLLLLYPAYIIAPSFYQAIGKPLRALSLSMARPIIGAVLMVVLARSRGAIGAVYADPVAVGIGAAIAVWYLFHSTKKIGEPRESD